MLRWKARALALRWNLSDTQVGSILGSSSCSALFILNCDSTDVTVVCYLADVSSSGFEFFFFFLKVYFGLRRTPAGFLAALMVGEVSAHPKAASPP